MERYYSDDPEAIFAEARVVSPNRKIISKSFSKSANPGTFDCEICYLTLPKAVSKNIFSRLKRLRRLNILLSSSCSWDYLQKSIIMSFLWFNFKKVPNLVLQV